MDHVTGKWPRLLAGLLLGAGLVAGCNTGASGGNSPAASTGGSTNAPGGGSGGTSAAPAGPVGSPAPAPPGLGRGRAGQIHLTWPGDPRTQIAVSWHTDAATASRLWVDGGDGWRTVAGLQSQPKPLGPGIYHEAEIAGLVAGREYRYTVSGDGGTSPVRTFRTGPAASAPFRFDAFADQGDCQSYKRVCPIISAIAADKPAFVVAAGDLSYANRNGPAAWDRWFQALQAWSTFAPIVPAPGNHEWKEAGDSIRNYKGRFLLPPAHQEDYYSFDYAGTHVVSLPETYVDTAAGGAFNSWLVTDLATARANPDTRWIVAFDHRPLYTTGAAHGPNKQFVSDIVPVLDTYNVDLMISGHEHKYERTLPIRDGIPTGSDARTIRHGLGTVYVVSGGGGAPLEGGFTREQPWDAVRAQIHEYLRVDVSDTAIHVRALGVDGKLIDDFTITKE